MDLTQSVTQVLTQFIQRELLNGHEQTELAEDDDLLLSGLVDSMGVVRLINFIEQELEVEVPPEDVTIDHFLTIRTIADYLATRRPG